MGERIDAGALGFLFDEAKHLAQHIARRRDAMEIEPAIGKPARLDCFLAALLQPRRIDDAHEPSLSCMKLAVLSELLQGAPSSRECQGATLAGEVRLMLLVPSPKI